MQNNFDRNFIQFDKKKEKEENRNLGFFLFWSITLYIFLIFFTIFFSWYTVFVSTHKYYAVSGASMKPTYNVEISDTDGKTQKDAVYVNVNDKISVFDVVVIETSNDSIIKRVMAKAGDYVTILAGTYEGQSCFYYYRIAASDFKATDEFRDSFVDEQAKLVEDNGEYHIASYSDWGNNREQFIYNGKSYEKNFYEHFILGEEYNYFTSNDGVVYVEVPDGYVFCMGDNRGHSKDSRQSGFYKESALVGRVEIVVYNFNFGNRLWVVVKFYFSQVGKFFAR
ncbi:MAG: signal peptidase I [Clostridia bacterium]|nr:signal peptidase I [Clostridia bacterium]